MNFQYDKCHKIKMDKEKNANMIFAISLLKVPPGSGKMFTKGGRKNGKSVSIGKKI